MTKPISRRLHSLIDYGFLAGNLVAPTLLGMSTKARVLFASFGAVQGTLNAVTQQPFALKQVVPFSAHGTIEKASGPVYALLPLALGIAGEPRARWYWLGLGAVLVAVYNLTDWNEDRPFAGQGGAMTDHY